MSITHSKRAQKGRQLCLAAVGLLLASLLDRADGFVPQHLPSRTQSRYVSSSMWSTSPGGGSDFYGRSFQPLGTPMKKDEPEPGFVLGIQEETVGSAFEEYLVNITKPLGIAVEEAIDGSGMVYIVDRGDKAEKVGVEIGDVVVGVSFIFGDDYLVNVTGQGVDRVQSLIRSRGPAYVCLRLRKGCEYHLMDKEDVAVVDEDVDAALEPEEQEAKWIERASKIFVEDFPVNFENIPEEYEER